MYEGDGGTNWKLFDLLVNGLWLVAFFINCNRVDYSRKIVTFKDTVGAYLASPFLIPDALVLIMSVTLILADEPKYAKYFELIRLAHFNEALFPVNWLVLSVTNSGAKRAAQIKSLIRVFYAFVMLGHLFACMWIVLGFWHDDKPIEERDTWLYVNDFNGIGDDGNTPLESNGAMYIFAYYWVFTTLTTVGYGDYSAGNSREYLIVLIFEFTGFCYNAILISVMSSFFDNSITFDDLLDERLAEMALWMKRLEQANYPYYMPPKLAKSIDETVRAAFHGDYNLIVEEYTLYQ